MTFLTHYNSAFPLLGAIPSVAQPYAYTSREADTAGLYYFRARYLDPSIGRFISEDPMRLLPNLYRYADNAPTVANDPLDLVAWNCIYGGA